MGIRILPIQYVGYDAQSIKLNILPLSYTIPFMYVIHFTKLASVSILSFYILATQ